MRSSVFFFVFTILSIAMGGLTHAQWGQFRQPKPMIWMDITIQRQLELSNDQRREMFELRLEYEEESYPIIDQQTALKKRLAIAAKQPDSKEKENLDSEIKRLQKEIEDLKSRLKKKADKILLAHQQERMDDIHLGRQVSYGFLLALPNVMKELGLSDKVKKKANKKLEEFNERLREILVEQITEATDDIIKEFPKDAQKRVKKLLENYHYKPTAKFQFTFLEQYFFKRKPKEKK